MAVLDQAMDLGSRRQKDLASGQMDLFGDFMEEEDSIDKLEMPKMQEFPKIELLNMEKKSQAFISQGIH